MNGREFWALKVLSNDELEASLSGLLGAGARVEARIVAHLAEVEARRLHLLGGYSSLYDYCRKRLKLSDYEAFARIAAARVARKYPMVFGMLERRELHLTAICEVRDFLSDENHSELLTEVAGKTKLQIREILACRFPQADIPASLKMLPSLEPLSPGRYRLLLTLSSEQKAKLELARDLLSHANTDGDLAVVVERALDELILRLEKRRFARLASQPGEDKSPPRDSSNRRRSPSRDARIGARESATRAGTTKITAHETSAFKRADAPEAAKGNADEPSAATLQTTGTAAVEHRATTAATKRRKHISHDIRRQVSTRDGVCCAFVGADGRRCDARAFLQFHHRHAWARGGPDTVDNLTLFCQAHNRLLAERDFGQTHIDNVITQHTARRRKDVG
jgi:hypothetical protein